MKARVAGMVAVLALGGCVEPYGPAAPDSVLGAYPGEGKTAEAFAQDDGACRTAAAQPLPSGLPGVAAVPPPPGAAAGGPAPGGTGTAPAAGPGAPAIGQGAPAFTPGMVYLRCMVVHGNIVQPIVASQPAAYAYYAPYPVYYGFGDYDPWLYGGAFDYPFFGGFYGGFGFFGRGGFGRGYGFGRGAYGHHFGGGYGHGYAGGFGHGFGGDHGRFGGGFGGGGFHGGGHR